MRKEITLAFFLLGSASVFAQGTAKIMYSDNSIPAALNKLSNNVKYAVGSQGVAVAAARWDLETGVVDLFPCSQRGIGYDISNGGLVVGECDNQPAYYDLETKEAVELPTGRGYNGGQVMGVTDDGSLMAGKIFDAHFKALPVIWSNDAYEELPTPLETPNKGGIIYTLVTDISSDGSIILGNVYGYLGEMYGIIWTGIAPNYEYKLYGTNIMGEYLDYSATRLSADGKWVVGETTSKDGEVYCYRYNIPEDKFEIITEKSGLFTSTGIANDGTIVAYEGKEGGDPMVGRMSYVIKDDHMIELGEYVRNNFGVELEGISTSCTVTDISGDGNTIIGFFMSSVFFRSFCVKTTPAEIASVTRDYEFSVNENSLVCPAGTSWIELYDMAGKKIAATTGMDFSLTGLAVGIYMVHAVVDGKIVVTKIIR